MEEDSSESEADNEEADSDNDENDENDDTSSHEDIFQAFEGGKRYIDIPLRTRVLLLKALCDWVLDEVDFLSEVAKENPDEMVGLHRWPVAGVCSCFSKFTDLTLVHREPYHWVKMMKGMPIGILEVIPLSFSLWSSDRGTMSLQFSFF